jgi:hypothetical protein
MLNGLLGDISKACLCQMQEGKARIKTLNGLESLIAYQQLLSQLLL